MYQKISGSEKIYASQRGGYQVSSSKTLCNTVPKNFVREHFGFRKFRVSQNFMHKKGISLNSVEKSLSHSTDKSHKRTLLCFERILVSKSFKQRRGEASRFGRKFFYLTEPKKLRQGTILCFRKFLVGKKFSWTRWGREGEGGITIFRPKVFVSLYQNISFENTLVFQKNSFIEIFHAQEGRGITGLSKIFCLTLPK